MRGCIIASIRRMCLRSSMADTALPAVMICGSARCLAWKMIISRFWGASRRWRMSARTDRGGAQDECRNGRRAEQYDKNVIREAKQYIQDNFQDPDLSVEKICRHLHMSPAYFSTMFKKETDRRTSPIRPMSGWGARSSFLMATDDKTYIIAEKVGYPEQNYFSYVFKKKNSVFPRRGTARHTGVGRHNG